MKILLTRASAGRIDARVRALAPTAEIVVVEEDGTVTGDRAGVKVIFWGVLNTPETVKSLLESWHDPALAWVQSPNAGNDNDVWHDLVSRGITLTAAFNVWTEPMAQYINAWILAWSQGLGGQMLRSQHHEWNKLPADDLTARTLGIIGFGGIGRPTARIAKAIGMRVLATRRTPGPADNVDEMFTPDQLHHVLAESDYVVLAVPLSDETRDLIGAAEFAAMGSETVFINVARGESVDEAALADALRNGKIRGATIDVTRTEPLPRESPLWELPNLVITPHQSGDGPLGRERLEGLFLRNLASYITGEPLENVVTG
jgi:phosphoglycerate dehydrogenase-like enzyme